MRGYDESAEINHNPNWPYFLDHLSRILIIGGSGSGKPNVLLNLVKSQQLDIDKICQISKIHSNQIINFLSIEEKK